MLCLPLTPTKLATEKVSRTQESGLLLHQDTLVVGCREHLYRFYCKFFLCKDGADGPF